ncbi:MAG: hypothetical protein JWP03_1725 [Phycisphaerales bacterium]|nr:hypothetical protein [Phycisphaerales bacterium]
MTAYHPIHSHSPHHLIWKYLLPILLGLLAFFFFASPVRGQVWVDASQLDGKVPDWVDRTYYRPAPPVCYQPPRVQRVWIEPAYRTVSDRVWVCPVTTTVCERVWVDAKYELRTVCACEGGSTVERQVLVLVQPGHFESRPREVVVCPGHWQPTTRQELVCAGHWQIVDP